LARGGQIGTVLASVPAVLVGVFLPAVENPWPDQIGIEFPFAVAGALGVLAGVFRGDVAPELRDRAIHRGGIWGFRLGAGIYALSAIVQLGFRQ
jgi:hypothetical protein